MVRKLIQGLVVALMLPILIVTYKWWGYGYYSHVIN